MANVAVCTVKKSIAAKYPTWFFSNFGHVCYGRDGGRIMYFKTDVSIPRLSNSPRIQGAPQSGFSRFIRRMRWRISRDTAGCRSPRKLDFRFQYRQTFAVPTNRGFRLRDEAAVPTAGPQTVELDPNCPVEGREPTSPVLLLLEGRQLVTEGHDLKLELGPGPKPGSYGRQQ